MHFLHSFSYKIYTHINIQPEPYLPIMLFRLFADSDIIQNCFKYCKTIVFTHAQQAESDLVA